MYFHTIIDCIIYGPTSLYSKHLLGAMISHNQRYLLYIAKFLHFFGIFSIFQKNGIAYGSEGGVKGRTVVMIHHCPQSKKESSMTPIIRYPC